MTTQAQRCNSPGRDLMSEAWLCLGDDDLQQASEKGWGAAAQMVKAASEARGWRHNGHRQLWAGVKRLADETEDRQILTLFGAADSLHTNSYEDWMPREIVEVYLGQVGELLDKLNRLPAR